MTLWTLGLTGMAVAGAAWVVRGRSSDVFGPSVWRGPRSGDAIALTFDDGPSESTPAILEVLARHRAPATFFQCGANVRRLSAVAREVAAAGHEIGNHSYTHSLLCLRSRRFIRQELVRAQDAIMEATGAAPRFFRAPYGVRWFGLREAQRELGLVGVMWTVIGLDWKLGADGIVHRIDRRAAPGAIICLHDGRRLDERPDIRQAVAATERLVPHLLARGFRFVTIGSLLCPTTSLSA